MLVYITSMESTQSFYLALYVKLELLWLNIWGRLQHFQRTSTGPALDMIMRLTQTLLYFSNPMCFIYTFRILCFKSMFYSSIFASSFALND